MGTAFACFVSYLTERGATLGGERLTYFGAFADVFTDGDPARVWIRRIAATYDEGRGGGRAILTLLCDAADAADVDLSVALTDDGSRNPRPLSRPEHQGWFHNYRFRRDAAWSNGKLCMTRAPASRRHPPAWLSSDENSREAWAADEPLAAFTVWWDDILPEDGDALEHALETAKNERNMQSFLESRPLLLVQHLGGGHGRWVIPQKKLGSEFVTDFMVAERHSYGYDWQAVELESPSARMFNQNGDPSAALVHAQRQILDWRSWLTDNLGYARRDRDMNGLGLSGIQPKVPGLIIMGRRADVPKGTERLRRELFDAMDIRIHSYDWLLDRARYRGGVCLNQAHEQESQWRARLDAEAIADDPTV